MGEGFEGRDGDGVGWGGGMGLGWGGGVMMTMTKLIRALNAHHPAMLDTLLPRRWSVDG